MKKLILPILIFSIILSLSTVQTLSQEQPAPQGENLSQGRLFGFGGEVFMPTLTVAYLSGRLWTSDTFGFDFGAGAITIPGIATFPSFLGRGLFKFVDQTTTDFYLAFGVSAVLLGGGPIMGTPWGGQATNFLIGLGSEFSQSKTMAFCAEIDLVIGGGGFSIIAGGTLHFYMGKK
ncbi:MAG: hypothetical protein NUW06_08065 [Candidatus Acetothermia bacterium]|jgi:hypothetical protein|nr:hypothetical protein [Candidatus Acetothermia bacterium]MDH7505963.1 hypothetical protein [Candidatus Acetothermia bacterium]